MKYKVVREESLDEVVERHYGESFGYLELVLKANIHLYKQDVLLKVGTIIELPSISRQPRRRARLI